MGLKKSQITMKIILQCDPMHVYSLVSPTEFKEIAPREPSTMCSL